VKNMGDIAGFHVPKHIQALREAQAKAREKQLIKELPEKLLKEAKPCKKKKKEKVTELTDEDAGAFGFSPEDHEVREE